jgi:hypothetical protein
MVDKLDWIAQLKDKDRLEASEEEEAASVEEEVDSAEDKADSAIEIIQETQETQLLY